jgi:hypothetical protein
MEHGTGRHCESAGGSVGFQVLLIQSRCVSSQGSGPEAVAKRTGQRLRAAVGCTSKVRFTGIGTGRGPSAGDNARIQVLRAQHTRNPGQRARGRKCWARTQREIYLMGARPGGGHFKKHPRQCQAYSSAGRAKCGSEARAGKPPGAPVLLQVYLLTAEAIEKGAKARYSKGSQEPIILGNGNRFLRDIFRRPPALRCRKWWRQGTRC